MFPRVRDPSQCISVTSYNMLPSLTTRAARRPSKTNRPELTLPNSPYPLDVASQLTIRHVISFVEIVMKEMGPVTDTHDQDNSKT